MIAGPRSCGAGRFLRPPPSGLRTAARREGARRRAPARPAPANGRARRAGERGWPAVRRCARPGTIAEGRRIAALRNVDPHRVVPTGAQIVALQSAAQLAGLHAHDRIGLRIEGRIAAEDLEGDGVRFQTVGAPREPVLHHEAQELLEPIRCDELGAREETLQLLAHRGHRRLRTPSPASPLSALNNQRPPGKRGGQSCLRNPPPPLHEHAL